MLEEKNEWFLAAKNPEKSLEGMGSTHGFRIICWASGSIKNIYNIVLLEGFNSLLNMSSGFPRALGGKSLALILATTGAISLGAISAPGTILAIGLMILGYANHEKLLIGLGALLIPIFLTLYYYNLDILLIDKSLILIGSGVILVLGRFYLRYAGLDK